jgi:uncharacterized protein YbaR (Trm112 family)
VSLVDPWLLSILRCPVCGGEVVEDEPASLLRCAACGTTYPVEDGIPNMLPPDLRDDG